jgi:hypothetical protein
VGTLGGCYAIVVGIKRTAASSRLVRRRRTARPRLPLHAAGMAEGHYGRRLHPGVCDSKAGLVVGSATSAGKSRCFCFERRRAWSIRARWRHVHAMLRGERQLARSSAGSATAGGSAMAFLLGAKWLW